MASKAEKKRVARKRMNQRARADHRRKAHAEKRRLRTAPLAEAWSGDEFLKGKDINGRLAKVSMKKILARFESDRPDLAPELRPILTHLSRPPGLETCKALTTALTMAAWAEYADLPDFAPMVVIGPQKDLRLGHVGTEEDAVGHGMSVRYDDYNPVLFLEKTGKVGAVSYRRGTLDEMARFLDQEDSRRSALLLDLAHGESSIRKEAILDGDLAPEPEPSTLAGRAPEKKKEWNPSPFRALLVQATAATAALEPPRPLVKWRVERKDDQQVLSNPDGGWRPFDTREEAEAAVPDEAWQALETPVVSAGIDPPRAIRARDDAGRLLAASEELGPCAAAEKAEAAAKALDGSEDAWGPGDEKEAFEAARKLLADAREAAADRPSTTAVAVWLLTGMKEPDGSGIHMKAGYLPLWMHEEKAHVVAESFMPCGAPGTPEHGLAGMEAMESPDATLADLVAAYGSQETVMALAERGLEPLLASREGRGQRPTFAPLTGFVAGTEERLAGL